MRGLATTVEGQHSQANGPMIAVRHLRKTFSGKVVLEDVNFVVERGTVCVVMGGSGSGKSTVLRHLIGAYKPDKGEIYLRICLSSRAA